MDRLTLDATFPGRGNHETDRTSFSPMIVPRKAMRFVDSLGFTLLAVHSTGMERGPVCVRMGSSVKMSSSTWTNRTRNHTMFQARCRVLQRVLLQSNLSSPHLARAINV